MRIPASAGKNPVHRVRAALMVAVAATVDNLLEAGQVESRLAAGARALRIEGDFVTCSQ